MSQARILQWGKTKVKVEEPMSVDKVDRRNSRQFSVFIISV